MDVKLIVVGGKHNGQAIKVKGPKFYIGRAEDCHLRPKSDLISRHHCAILIEDDLLTIRDFGSKNGTILNDEPVYGEEDLENGDVLTIGPLTFKVDVNISLGGPKKPKVESIEEAAQRTVESGSKKSDDDDLDISDWLAGENEDVTSTRTQTNILDKETLAQMLNEQSQETTVENTEEKAAEKEPKDKKDDKKDKKEPGRLNPVKKPKMIDSQAAAEDTLRNFFHRR
ncbi:MAG: FHA domain-containing protein [Planctomycetia bacterium]|jgi:pSer/pThr/pTyr-binding forkhead associated (FHA) protein